MRAQRSALALGCLAALTLAGCGGGGGADTPAPVVQTPAAVTLTGVVAKGAAFSDAVVTVTDSTGAVVGTSATVGSDGIYRVTLAAGAKAPFVLVATRAAANGQTESLVSVASSAEATQINLTPVTTLIAALLSPSGDPAKLATELASGTAQVTTDTVAGKVSQVQTLLAPLITATNTAATDPLTGSFSANGTGYDRLLDSVHVAITPATSTRSNIEVAVKQQTADAAQPASVSFTSDATTVAALPAVDASTLVEEGVSVKITRLLADLTSCYAVPLADRVNGATAESTAVVGTAADIKAAACKSVFVGGDPAGYLSNGNRVGRDASGAGAFNSLFRSSATGVVFSQGSYEFTRANGDLVVGYKSRDLSGNEGFDTLVVRKDASDGRLKLVGNQYAYPGGVVPYQQLRQFVTLDQSTYNFRSSGYTVNVDNRTDASGNPIFARVEVETPRGGTLLLKPARGYSYLTLVKSGTSTGTNFVRLRSEFVNPAVTADFATMEPGLFFAGTPLSDSELAAVPSQAVWTFRYFLAGNTGSTPDAVQTYKTRARALTIGELSMKRFATLTDQVLAAMRSNASPTTGTIVLPTDGAVDMGDAALGGGWTVASDAMPPTSVSLYGSYRGSGFNDAVNFGSTARTTRIGCSAATAADLHCSTSVPGAFASGAVATGLHLWSRDSSGREYANFYAAYKLTLP